MLVSRESLCGDSMLSIRAPNARVGPSPETLQYTDPVISARRNSPVNTPTIVISIFTKKPRNTANPNALHATWPSTPIPLCWQNSNATPGSSLLTSHQSNVPTLCLWWVGLHARTQAWHRHFQANTYTHSPVLSVIYLAFAILSRHDCIFQHQRTHQCSHHVAHPYFIRK